MRRCGWLLVLSVAAGNVSAATIRVPGDQTTIQAGIDAAQAGDTVLVAAGRYAENLVLGDSGICLRGETGPGLTILEPDSTGLPILDVATGDSLHTLIAGFTFRKTRGSTAVRVWASSPIIRDNIFTDCRGGAFGNDAIIYVAGGSMPLISRNVFQGNDSAYCVIFAGYGNPATILNNTISGGRLGVYLYGPGGMLKNNIITGCQTGLSGGASAIVGYNDIWGNDVNGALAETDISADPWFAGLSSGDFSLLPGSPCMDGGEIAPIYNDPDGTRSDIGGITFDQTCPSVNDIRLSAEDIAHVLAAAPAFAWRYYDTTHPEQYGYEIQVGADADWAVAELWDSGPMVSADSETVYAGAPLEDGQVYMWRVRVDNGGTQSEWKEAAFRMNAAPTAPTPQFPVDAEGVSSEGVYLAVFNASDVANDELVYEFEIYADPGLAGLVASRANVAQGVGVTASGLWEGLAPGPTYWWRARAFDGSEYSEWSLTESFVVRTPGVVHVPGDQTTIQAGIDAAQEGDTVLVAPGVYSGEGNRDLDFHGVNIVLLSDGIGQATINCGGSAIEPHRAVYLHNSEDTTAVIDGFIITGAYMDGYWNGVITFQNAGGTARNCLVIANESRGITASSTAPNYYRYRVNIENCRIEDNHCGIASVANGAITDCEIINNDSTGIFLASMDSLTVANCLIAGNDRFGISTTTGSWGHYLIGNNTIVLNGTGFYFWYDPPKEAPAQLSVDRSGITANLVAFNTDMGIQGDGLGFVGVTVSCNNAFGNPGGDYHPVYEWGPQAGDTLGNISADPLFCDLDTAYSVSGASPCLSANNSCGVLIGAFGEGCGFVCGDMNGSGGEPDVADLTYLVNALFRGGPMPALEPADVNNSGDITITDLTYLVAFLFRGGPPPACG